MSKLESEDLELLRDTATRFFDEKLPIGALRKERDAPSADGFDRALWREMADMGWAGILLGEADGGIDFGYAALGEILEQTGRTLAATPLLSTVLLGAPLVAAGGSEPMRADVLPRVASGEMILALALDEARRHEPWNISTTARSDGDGYVLNGSKTFVLDGHVADKLIVLARTGGAQRDRAGLSLFLTDANAAGIIRRRATMVDARNAAKITFDNLTVPGSALLGAAGAAADCLEPILDGARAGLAAEMLGTGLEAFDRTIEYLKIREQFGAPIGSFQGLKHRAALMYCEIELARSSTYAALNAIDNGADDAAELASLAKAKACDMLELVSNEAVQMHGGIGMTDDVDIGLFLKHARVAQQTLGDVLYHRARYADLIGI